MTSSRSAPPESPAQASPATHTITLTVDRQLVTARQGESLLDVLRATGVHVPVLCAVEGLSTVGACRLCLVEVAGRPKLAAACVTAAEEGMEITTNSDKLRRYRAMTVELLFAERNHICAVCVSNGHCELQDLASEVGVDHVEFEYLSPAGLQVDLTHPRFGADPNRCVLCTRCVRVCDEVEGAHVWDVAGRGTASYVITDLAQPWGESSLCTSCGKCVQACPTGALFESGATIGEQVKQKEQLTFLTAARQERVWLVDIAAGGAASTRGEPTASSLGRAPDRNPGSMTGITSDARGAQ